MNGSACHHNLTCSPFTLPKVGDVHIPICQNVVDEICYGEVLEDLKLDLGKYCKKSCHSHEYKIRNAAMGTWAERYKPWDWTGKDSKRSHILEFKFEKPKMSLGGKSLQPLKKVSVEHLSISLMSLVGNVGGTLGMFIGFSFIGFAEWIMQVVAKATKVLFT